MSADTENSGSRGEPAPAEQRATPPQGWLAGLRTRLGLTGAQSLRDTLEAALKGQAAGHAAFTAEEREMLLRLLRFGALRVEDVMVPRADIIAIDEKDSVAQLLARFEEAEVSRIPLYRDTLDDPRGMVHIKDLMKWLMSEAAGAARTSQEAKMPASAGEATTPGNLTRGLVSLDLNRTIASTRTRRQVLYVPPSMPATNLLLRMQSTRIHMALVVDEYGGTDGLVTIEDLVEQIVGEIEDEHDEAEAEQITEDAGGLIAAARTPVSELEQRLGIKLQTTEEAADVDTLGGLVFALVGRVPARGEVVRHSSGIELEVLDADPRRVKKLRVHRAKTADSAVPTEQAPKE